jgi:hypothetical protein
MVMKPANESSSKPTAQDIEKSAGDIAELQALIVHGLESGAAQLFDKAAFLTRMKTRNGGCN